MSAGIIAFLIILDLIAVSKDTDRYRGEPEPSHTLVGCGCLGVAVLFWIVLILNVATAG